MIVNFEDYKRRVSNKDHLKMRAQGRIREVVCNSCGEYIEIYNGIIPNSCPGCNKIIVGSVNE